MKNLFEKYDIQAPRYTSYPTVPYWETTPTSQQWLESLQKSLTGDDKYWSMYLHIPFCESLCTFCGCNTVITKDHSKETTYIQTLLQEWAIYKKAVPQLSERKLKHLHLGGGTPTFLSAQSLKNLLQPILQDVQIDSKDFEGSIEVDPRRTTLDQLKVLRDLGFNRVSMGVQDFNPEVQKLVNRIQPYQITADLTKVARDLGYQSVNFDLIYGLAKQTVQSITETIQQTIELSPDRIALYSLALVPWIKPAQRLFKDEDLPAGEEKRRLYETARTALLNAGYLEIGMDHFAKPTEALAKAFSQQKLHRNFMGYTDHRTDVLLGLGVSSISETKDMFYQNEKIFPQYESKLATSEVPGFRGHVLTVEDQQRREQILEFMTRGEVKLTDEQKNTAPLFLTEMIQDDLVKIEGDRLILLQKGKPFLRNVCLFFDERLKRKQPAAQVFSKTL